MDRAANVCSSGDGSAAVAEPLVMSPRHYPPSSLPLHPPWERGHCNSQLLSTLRTQTWSTMPLRAPSRLHFPVGWTWHWVYPRNGQLCTLLSTWKATPQCPVLQDGKIPSPPLANCPIHPTSLTLCSLSYTLPVVCHDSGCHLEMVPRSLKK